MKTPLLLLLLISLSGLVCAQEEPPIDWDKARELHRRDQRGETLQPEEKAYLDRAREERRKQRPASAPQSAGNQRKPPDRLIPLTDLQAEEVYEGQDGGLYGEGRNDSPEELAAQAQKQLALIQPLDAEGVPAEDGKIVFISISMSNATQEFSTFKKLADAAPEKSSQLTIVDCAQGGQAMEQWAPEDAQPWQVAIRRLSGAEVTPQQVQVAWVKLANKSPTGSLEEHGKKLEADTLKVLQNAKAKFPNLRIAFLGSRIWAGNARGNLNPEPYAYESAFPVRWLIQRQMAGDAELSLDKAPLLLWGPYLWAEGEQGRKTDDLVWLPEDFAGDGVHPSPSGREKVAQLLLDFCLEDSYAKPWFVGK